MNETKKNSNERCDEKERRELTPEELEQVTGGTNQFASVAEGKPGDNAGFRSVR